MIVTEKVSGTIFRLYEDKDVPKFTAIWILTDENEIKGLLFKKLNKNILFQFKNWLNSLKDGVRTETAIESIETFLKRHYFKELVKVGEKQMTEKLTMKISVDVTGKEGLSLDLVYKDTTMETVILVEKALLGALATLMES